MDSKELFSKAIEEAWGCIKEVNNSQMDFTTPCDDWDLKTLLNHVINEIMWLPELLNGKTIAQVGNSLDGDLLGDNPAVAWRTAADKALEIVNKAELTATVELSYGKFTADHYIAEVGVDVLIHGWDVGQAIHCSLMFEPDVAKAAYDHTAPNIKAYRASGALGPKIAVAPNATIQTRLLAMFGRRSPKLEEVAD